MTYEIKLNDLNCDGSKAATIDVRCSCSWSENGCGAIEDIRLVLLEGQIWFGKFAVSVDVTDDEACREAGRFIAQHWRDEVIEMIEAWKDVRDQQLAEEYAS